MSNDRSSDPHGETSYHLRRALEGDAESLEQVVRRLTPLLLSLATYRLKALPPGLVEPSDLVNEIWLRAIPRLEALVPRGDRVTPVVLRYLAVAMRRRVRDLLATQLRRDRDPVPRAAGDDLTRRLAADSRGVVSRVVEQEHRGLVCQAMDELDDKDREVVLLRGIEQTPTREVAALVGVSEDAVKQRYRRALRRLRERLPDSVFDEI